MEQQLLLKSSNNLTEMIKLLKIHEETISRVTRARVVTDTQIVDLFNVVITNENMRLNNRENATATANPNDIYLETTYSQINSPLSTSCPITREDFLDNDAVIMIRECRHIFKKTAFQTWIENNNTCPCCRITLNEE
jgi:hypothetical protein